MLARRTPETGIGRSNHGHRVSVDLDRYPVGVARRSVADLRSVSAVWAARVAWLALAVLGGGAFGEALAPHSRGVQVAGTVALWVGWAAGALALAVPSTVSLTLIRSGAPVAVVAAVMAAFGADGALSAALAVGTATVATAAVATGELGQAFVQASAYGHEQRFVLRPPAWVLVPAATSWAALCAATVGAPLAWGARAWALAASLTFVAVGLGWVLGQRFHRLSRRWLVLVPVGVVIHDHLVLGETVMLRTKQLDALGLALADTDAADLTGPAGGHAVEIGLRAHETVVFAPTRAEPNGRAIHARGVLVAPTRPGHFLAAAAQRGLPVR